MSMEKNHRRNISVSFGGTVEIHKNKTCRSKFCKETLSWLEDVEVGTPYFIPNLLNNE